MGYELVKVWLLEYDLLPTIQVDKVQYLSYINGLDPEEKKKAELALFCQQPQQAESIYLQSNHIFRAIQLNIQLFNWER